jgi:uncharacterized protein YbjT (DUF2867 family)
VRQPRYDSSPNWYLYKQLKFPLLQSYLVSDVSLLYISTTHILVFYETRRTMSNYLVTQATGHQSQWTIEHLLAAGAKVHALVRDPQKVPVTLERPGITVFGRDNDNPEAIFKAAQGCKGVFLNTHPSQDDIDSEGRQAKVVLDACKKAGVEIVVASTSFYTGDKSMWGDATSQELVGFYYQSKTNIENAVRAAGLKTYTILRPAFISHDYTLPRVYYNYPDLPTSGTLAHAFNNGTRILQIDEHDIGKYAAAALLDPVKFGGHEIELANECLTIEEVRDIIVKVSGRDIKVQKWTKEEIEVAKTSVFAARFELWANIKIQSSSAKETEERFGIPFTSLESYFQREKAELLACLPAET